MQFAGVAVDPSQMLATAVVHDCTFVARGFALDIEGLSKILERAIAHRGLSLVDVIQPCITWGNHPVEWYRERAVPIPEDHDPSDRDRAIALALEVPDRFPIGVLYERESKETFGETYRQEHGAQALFTIPPIERSTIERKLENLRIGAKN